MYQVQKIYGIQQKKTQVIGLTPSQTRPPLISMAPQHIVKQVERLGHMV